MAGYTKTPLAKKLGIKDNHSIRLINAPDYYFGLFTDLPENIKILKGRIGKKDLIHYFETDAKHLKKNILKLKNEIQENGIIWVSWYKKSSKIITDVSENLIREIALDHGLVDIKVCAIDDLWSGLKLVIPVKERQVKKH